MTKIRTTISPTITRLTAGGRWPPVPEAKPTIAAVIRNTPNSRNSTTSGTCRLRPASRRPKLSIMSLSAWMNSPDRTGLGSRSAARPA